MKVLFVATVRSHIGQFHMPFIRELVRRGCRVEAAFKDNSADKPGLDLSGIARTYEVPFSRSPYSVDNLKAYQVLKKIIDEGRYDAIHCHTPMGAVVTRLAARDARKRGTKVIYTAHGFHFYNGAARKNWLLFYPVEKALAKDTDCLITINSEDYNTAKARQFAAGRLELVNGVGVDLSDFQPVTREQKLALRRAYGYSPDDFILIYPADFSARKNQNMLFDTLKLLLEKDKHFRLLLPGSDVEARPFLDYAKSIGVADHVEALGYEFFAMSAATHQGTRELVQHIAQRLSELPPVTVYEPEYVPKPPVIDTTEPLHIEREDNTWLVEGPWLQRLMGNINFSDYESRMYFDKMLRQSGLFDTLEQMGIQDGDIVSMYDLEFEYQR